MALDGERMRAVRSSWPRFSTSVFGDLIWLCLDWASRAMLSNSPTNIALHLPHTCMRRINSASTIFSHIHLFGISTGCLTVLDVTKWVQIGYHDQNYIHKHSLPLAVPAATQSSVGWNLATAGTAVMPSPPSCASCWPLAVYMSTKRFMLPMQNRWTPS